MISDPRLAHASNVLKVVVAIDVGKSIADVILEEVLQVHVDSVAENDGKEEDAYSAKDSSNKNSRKGLNLFFK